MTLEDIFAEARTHKGDWIAYARLRKALVEAVPLGRDTYLSALKKLIKEMEL